MNRRPVSSKKRSWTDKLERFVEGLLVGVIFLVAIHLLGLLI